MIGGAVRGAQRQALETGAAVLRDFGVQLRPLAVEFLPQDADAPAGDGNVRAGGLLTADKPLALDAAVCQTPIKGAALAILLVEPDGMPRAIGRHGQRRPVVGAAIDFPAVEGGALDAGRRSVRLEFRQRMVALVGLEYMPPEDQRGAVGIDGRRDPAALAGMVGDPGFRLEASAAVVRYRRVDGGAAIGVFAALDDSRSRLSIQAR